MQTCTQNQVFRIVTPDSLRRQLIIIISNNFPEIFLIFLGYRCGRDYTSVLHKFFGIDSGCFVTVGQSQEMFQVNPSQRVSILITRKRQFIIEIISNKVFVTCKQGVAKGKNTALRMASAATPRASRPRPEQRSPDVSAGLTPRGFPTSALCAQGGGVGQLESVSPSFSFSFSSSSRNLRMPLICSVYFSMDQPRTSTSLR